LRITINGEVTPTNARTIDELRAVLGHWLDKIATARNGNFVPVMQRAKTPISENDSIEIVTPRQGG